MGGLRGGRRRLVISLMDGRHSVSEQCFPKAAATSVSGRTAQTTSAAGAHPSGRFTTCVRACVCVYKCVTRAGKSPPQCMGDHKHDASPGFRLSDQGV